MPESGYRARVLAKRGFTLPELILVVGIIAMVMSVAVPMLLPAIDINKLEGSAKHLSNYGRAILSHCSMTHESLTFVIDLDHQEYWAYRWLEEEDDGLFEDDEDGWWGDSDSFFGDKGGNDARSSMYPDEDTEEMLEQQGEEMRLRFEKFARLRLQAQAKNVQHDGILSDIGPLFEKDFELDPDEDEELKEEVMDDLLERVLLDERVYIESVTVGNTDYVRGEVEIEVSPLGLSEMVVFYINGGGDYYTVVWDAVTADTRMYDGKELI